MATDDPSVLTIASLKKIPVSTAEAYVKSICVQISLPGEAARVARAIVGLLQEGKKLKPKDVAERLAREGIQRAAAEPAVEPSSDGASRVADPGPIPAPKPDPESRRDTRLRFEQWARNPRCEANILCAVHGISMARVAEMEGLRPSMGQSPFALARGEMFESQLFKNSAERLRGELRRQRVIPSTEVDFRDFRMRRHGGPYPNLDQACHATIQMLTEIAGTPGPLPIVAAGATIRIPGGVMLPEAILVMDVIVVRRSEDVAELLVGEVKTFPDRGGYTDPKELAVARAQAGVYVHGLRIVINELGDGARLRVSNRGFLVLSRPGFNAPSVRADEDLEFQARRAERGFEKLSKAAALLPGGKPVTPSVIRSVDTAYGEACIAFCDRAPLCYRKAVEDGNPVILGEDVARWVGLLGLPRAIELLSGRNPETPAERDFVRRVSEAEVPEFTQ